MALDCINIEDYLLGFFVFLILFGNLAIYRMDKNVTDSFKQNPIKPTLWQAFLWEVAMPKKFLTARGLLWRKASIGCCIGFTIFIFCWLYFQKVEWVCEFQMVPK